MPFTNALIFGTSILAGKVETFQKTDQGIGKAVT